MKTLVIALALFGVFLSGTVSAMADTVYPSDIDFNGIENVELGMFDLDVGGDENHQISGTEINAVPVPAAAWLLGSGLIGLVAINRHYHR